MIPAQPRLNMCVREHRWFKYSGQHRSRSTSQECRSVPFCSEVIYGKDGLAIIKIDGGGEERSILLEVISHIAPCLNPYINR